MNAAVAAEAPRAAVFPPGPRDRTPFPFTRGMRDDPLGFVGGPLLELRAVLARVPAHGVRLRIERRHAA